MGSSILHFYYNICPHPPNYQYDIILPELKAKKWEGREIEEEKGDTDETLGVKMWRNNDK